MDASSGKLRPSYFESAYIVTLPAVQGNRYRAELIQRAFDIDVYFCILLLGYSIGMADVCFLHVLLLAEHPAGSITLHDDDGGLCQLPMSQRC
ncbi:hypothetical protein SBA3_3490014 [Candidatus Sulfopaludibacter sp. SbA3]|nr:hypothetical protein SBA3_3490014 [Candidatus Sulfopaludibacter sp. SbA3]